MKKKSEIIFITFVFLISPLLMATECEDSNTQIHENIQRAQVQSERTLNILNDIDEVSQWTEFKLKQLRDEQAACDQLELESQYRYMQPSLIDTCNSLRTTRLERFNDLAADYAVLKERYDELKVQDKIISGQLRLIKSQLDCILGEITS